MSLIVRKHIFWLWVLWIFHAYWILVQNKSANGSKLMKHPQKSQLISFYKPAKKHICTEMLTHPYICIHMYKLTFTQKHIHKQPKHIYTQTHLHTHVYASAETYIITYRCTHIYPHIDSHSRRIIHEPLHITNTRPHNTHPQTHNPSLQSRTLLDCCKHQSFQEDIAWFQWRSCHL